jgi:hypothetical protein
MYVSSNLLCCPYSGSINDLVDDDDIFRYLGEMPNTYVFTKQLAEHVVYEHRGLLPAVIIRPSIGEESPRNHIEE